MSRLDEVEADENGFYPVEISINGKWITLSRLTLKHVEDVCDLASSLAGEEDA